MNGSQEEGVEVVGRTRKEEISLLAAVNPQVRLHGGSLAEGNDPESVDAFQTSIPDLSESGEDEVSEVESFMMNSDEEVEPQFVLPTVTGDVPNVDPHTQERLDALLEAAGIRKFSTGAGEALSDPEVLRKLTSSVSTALDEAASALSRMRGDGQAAADGTDSDLREVRKVLSEGQGVSENEDGESLLSLACSAGYFELAQVLLAMRANVEDRGIKGDCTPLMEAASGGYTDIVKLLIGHGADVNAQSSAGNTALHYAACGGYEEVVQELISHGANVEEHNENGHTPLMEAASAGHVQVAHILLEAGAGINTHSNEFKESALTLACYKGHLDMVKYLLEAGADHEHKTDEMHTALMEAAMDGHVEVARLLLDNGAQVNMPVDSFESPLTLAACGGHVELAALLIDRGANLEEGNDEGYTPLMEASREGHEEMVQLLLSHKANVNAQTEETQETALTLACCGGFLDVAKLLIDAGADLELGCSSPLMEAAQEGHLDLVKYLLEKGANVHAQTGTGDSALTWASENGHTEVAEVLLDHGADLEHESEGGRTPLMKAVRAGHQCTVEFLISRGADVNRRTTSNDHTVLSLACSGGHIQIVELLLQRNADPTHKLKDGSTMLIEAAKGGHSTVVNLLFEWSNQYITGDSPLAPMVYDSPQLNQVLYDTMGPLALAPPHEQIPQPASDMARKAQLSASKKVKPAPAQPLHTKLNQPSKNIPGDKSVQDMISGLTAEGGLIDLGDAADMGTTTSEQLEKKQQILKDLHRMEKELQEKVMEQLLTKKGGGVGPPSAPAVLPPSPGGKSYHKLLHVALKAQLDKKIAADSAKDLKPSLSEAGQHRADASQGKDLHSPVPLHVAFKNQLQHQAEAQKKAAAEGRSPVSVEVSLDDEAYEQAIHAARDRGLQSSEGSAFTRVAASSPGASDSSGKKTTNSNPEGASSNPVSMPASTTSLNALSTALNSYTSSAKQGQDIAAAVSAVQPPLYPPMSFSQQGQPMTPEQQQLLAQVQAQAKAATGALAPQEQVALHALTPQQQQQMLQSLQAQAQPGAQAAWPSLGQVTLTQAQLQQLTQQQLKILQMQMQRQQEHQQQAATQTLGAVDPTLAATAAAQQHTQTVSTQYPGGAAPQQYVNPATIYQRNIDLNAQTESNHDTALTLACAGGHADLVKLLIDRNADIEHRDKKGFTPLILAATAGHTEVVRILLDHGADIEAHSERTKDTPLSLACSGGRYEVVELLLNKSANKEHRNVSDYTPLSLAASGGYVPIIKLLLSHGAEINSRTGSKLGISPLMLAAMNGHTAAVKLLLDMGSDINAQIETNKNTALTLACFQGRHEVVSLLVERKANIEHRAKTGLTPLMEAASGGYVEVGRVLLDRQADVNAAPVPSSRDTALTIAADKGHYRFVELLIQRRAQVDVKNKKGNSPLWLACSGGHLDVVQLLVAAKADIHSCDNRNISCLMAAFRKGHVKVVKWLVKHVTQFPSDQECMRFIQTITNDKDLVKKCQQCMELIIAAKERQAAEANKHASSLLAEIDMERKREEQKKEAQKRKKAKKQQKKKEKKEREIEKEKEKEVKEPSPAERRSTGSGKGRTQSSTPDLDEDVIPTPAPGRLQGSESAAAIQQRLGAVGNGHDPVLLMNYGVNADEDEEDVTSSEGVSLSKRKRKNRRNKERDRHRHNEENVNPSSSTSAAARLEASMSVGSASKSSSRKAVASESLQFQAKAQQRHEEYMHPPPVDSSPKSGVNELDDFGIGMPSTSTVAKSSTSKDKAHLTSPTKHRVWASGDGHHVIVGKSLSTPPKSPGSVISPRKGKKDEGWNTVSRKSKKILLPQNIVPRVAGIRNANLQAIREHTGATVELDKPTKGVSERCITVKGPSENTRQASQLVNALIKEPDQSIENLIPGLRQRRQASSQVAASQVAAAAATSLTQASEAVQDARSSEGSGGNTTNKGGKAHSPRHQRSGHHAQPSNHVGPMVNKGASARPLTFSEMAAAGTRGKSTGQVPTRMETKQQHQASSQHQTKKAAKGAAAAHPVVVPQHPPPAKSASPPAAYNPLSHSSPFEQVLKSKEDESKKNFASVAAKGLTTSASSAVPPPAVPQSTRSVSPPSSDVLSKAPGYKRPAGNTTQAKPSASDTLTSSEPPKPDPGPIGRPSSQPPPPIPSSEPEMYRSSVPMGFSSVPTSTFLSSAASVVDPGVIGGSRQTLTSSAPSRPTNELLQEPRAAANALISMNSDVLVGKQTHPVLIPGIDPAKAPGYNRGGGPTISSPRSSAGGLSPRDSAGSNSLVQSTDSLGSSSEFSSPGPASANHPYGHKAQGLGPLNPSAQEFLGPQRLDQSTLASLAAARTMQAPSAVPPLFNRQIPAFGRQPQQQQQQASFLQQFSRLHHPPTHPPTHPSRTEQLAAQRNSNLVSGGLRPSGLSQSGIPPIGTFPSNRTGFGGSGLGPSAQQQQQKFNPPPFMTHDFNSARPGPRDNPRVEASPNVPPTLDQSPLSSTTNSPRGGSRFTDPMAVYREPIGSGRPHVQSSANGDSGLGSQVWSSNTSQPDERGDSGWSYGGSRTSDMSAFMGLTAPTSNATTAFDTASNQFSYTASQLLDPDLGGGTMGGTGSGTMPSLGAAGGFGTAGMGGIGNGFLPQNRVGGNMLRPPMPSMQQQQQSSGFPTQLGGFSAAPGASRPQQGVAGGPPLTDPSVELQQQRWSVAADPMALDGGPSSANPAYRGWWGNSSS